MFNMTTLTTEERIKKQIISLIDTHPFWSYLILKMKISEDKKKVLEGAGGGAGINAKGEMIYSKKWFDMLTDDEIKFVLAHEVGHLVFGHLIRRNNRQELVWNFCADGVLNTILEKNGFVLVKQDKSRPERGGVIYADDKDELVLFETTIKNVSKHTAEYLYDKIPSKNVKQIEEMMNSAAGVDGKGNKQFDIHIEGENMTQAEKEKIEEKWKSGLVEAATYAKMRGKLPLGMEGLIGDILDPKMNWKQIIAKYVRSMLPYDNSFSRPNKKFLANNLILPGVIKESIDIVIALDTSGSISDIELRQFLSEMKGIAKSHSNVNMTVIQADAEVQKVTNIKTQTISELMSFQVKGRGGTSHEPVFEYIKKNIKDCKLLIAFTDGYSDIDSLERPKYDVIWGLTSDGTDTQMKFGKVLKL